MSNKKLIHQYVTTGRKVPKEQVGKLSKNQLNSYLRTRLLGGTSLEPYEFFMVPYVSQSKYLDGINSMDTRVLIGLTQEDENFLEHLDVLLSHDKVIKNYDLNTLGRSLKRARDKGYVDVLVKKLISNEKFRSSIKEYDMMYFLEYMSDFRDTFKIFGERLVQLAKDIEPHNIHTLFLVRKHDKFEFLKYLNEVAPSVLGKIHDLEMLTTREGLNDRENEAAEILLSNKYFTHNMNSDHLVGLTLLLDDPFTMERYLSEKKIKSLWTDYLSDESDRKWMEKNIADGGIPEHILKFIKKYK